MTVLSTSKNAPAVGSGGTAKASNSAAAAPASAAAGGSAVEVACAAASPVRRATAGVFDEGGISSSAGMRPLYPRSARPVLRLTGGQDHLDRQARLPPVRRRPGGGRTGRRRHRCGLAGAVDPRRRRPARAVRGADPGRPRRRRAARLLPGRRVQAAGGAAGPPVMVPPALTAGGRGDPERRLRESSQKHVRTAHVNFVHLFTSAY